MEGYVGVGELLITKAGMHHIARAGHRNTRVWVVDIMFIHNCSHIPGHHETFHRPSCPSQRLVHNVYVFVRGIECHQAVSLYLPAFSLSLCSSSSLSSWSILAPLEGSLPCALAGRVASFSRCLSSSDFSSLSFSRFSSRSSLLAMDRSSSGVLLVNLLLQCHGGVWRGGCDHVERMSS
jgi:hypothetical protein